MLLFVGLVERLFCRPITTFHGTVFSIFSAKALPLGLSRSIADSNYMTKRYKNEVFLTLTGKYCARKSRLNRLLNPETF